MLANRRWKFIGSKQDFSDWIKARIAKYEFVQGVDFIDHKVMGQYNQVVTIDYFLTIDTAKEIAMVENSDKGREIRRYFIECERRALQPMKMPTLPEALEGWAKVLREKEALALDLEAEQKDNALMRPKADMADSIAKSDSEVTVGEAAKLFGKPAKELRSFMMANRWVSRDGKKPMPWAGRLPGTSRHYRPAADLPRRCEGYAPGPADPDRRTGLARWPGFGHPAMRGLKQWQPPDKDARKKNA